MQQFAVPVYSKRHTQWIGWVHVELIDVKKRLKQRHLNSVIYASEFMQTT